MFLSDEHKTQTKEDGRNDPPIQLYSDSQQQESFYSTEMSCDLLQTNDEVN